MSSARWLGAGGALLFAGAAVAAQPPEVQGFATTSPGGAAATASDAAHGPRLQWVRSVPQSIFHAPTQREMAKPLILGDKLLVGTSREPGILVYDRISGVLLGKWETKGAVEASPTWDPASKSVYAADVLGHVYRFSADGQLLWSVDREKTIVSPLQISGDMVFYRTVVDDVGLLSAEDGAFRWSYGREAPPDTAILGSSAVSVRGGRAYAGFADGSVVCLDTDSGTAEWESPIADPKARWLDTDVVSLVDDHCLFVSTYEGPSMCLAPETGAIEWSRDFAALSAPLVQGDRLIFASLGGVMQAVSRATGDELWRWVAPKPVNDGPAWRQRTARPILWNGDVVFGTSRGYVYGLSPEDGAERWRFRPWIDAFGFYTQPATTDASLYLLSSGGDLYHLAAEGWQAPAVDAPDREAWDDAPVAQGVRSGDRGEDPEDGLTTAETVVGSELREAYHGVGW